MEEGRQQNTGYLNASAAAERLQRNVNREHFLCTDFLLAFWQVRASCCQRQPGVWSLRARTLTAQQRILRCLLLFQSGLHASKSAQSYCAASAPRSSDMSAFNK